MVADRDYDRARHDKTFCIALPLLLSFSAIFRSENIESLLDLIACNNRTDDIFFLFPLGLFLLNGRLAVVVFSY